MKRERGGKREEECWHSSSPGIVNWRGNVIAVMIAIKFVAILFFDSGSPLFLFALSLRCAS